MNPHDSSSPVLRLTATYVDECLEQGRPEMERLKGRVARSLKDALKHGASEQELAAALHLLVLRRIRNPWKLAELVVELLQDQIEEVAARPSVRQQASAWINTNGWPSGARMVRGEGGAATLVYDPLGLERIPSDYGWPFARPGFDDVCNALAAL